MARANLNIRAFTLVELLVVIAIIGILVGLLLPAVQAAREAARRTQCRNQLKQVALAMHTYESAHKTLPAGARCNEATTGRAGENIFNCHNWFISLLPYMEQSAAYDRLDFTKRTRESPNAEVILGWEIPSMKCPSDANAGLSSHERFTTSGFSETTHIAGRYTDTSMGASYLPSGGPVYGCSPTGLACTGSIYKYGGRPDRANEQPGARAGAVDGGAPGMFAGGWIAYKFRQCTDGLSNTYLAGEVLPNLSLHHMLFNSHYIVGSQYFPPNNHQLLGYVNSGPYTSSREAGIGFKSEHPGGVTMAMADGSVDFVNDTIDYVIWFRTGDKADGQVGATETRTPGTR